MRAQHGSQRLLTLSNGTKIVTGSCDRTARVWDAVNEEEPLLTLTHDCYNLKHYMTKYLNLLLRSSQAKSYK